MDPSSVVNLLLTVLGVLLSAIGGWFVFEFRELRKSIDKLNLSVAHVIERIEAHEERLDRLDALLSAR